MRTGTFVVHTANDPIFTQGKVDRGQGLEGLAENGGGADLAASLTGKDNIKLAQAFGTTVNTGAAGPALPGDAYTFTFSAEDGDRLSLATMWVQSNDLFFAPTRTGISLFNSSGDPVSGVFTSAFRLWDAGTEANEAPGVGPNQAPRQSAAGAGTQDSIAIAVPNDGSSYPSVGSVIRVTITPAS